jgi:hypothetical protein
LNMVLAEKIMIVALAGFDKTWKPSEFVLVN